MNKFLSIGSGARIKGSINVSYGVDNDEEEEEGEHEEENQLDCLSINPC